MDEDQNLFLKIHNSFDTAVCSLLQVIPIYLLGLLQTFYYLHKDNFHQFFISLYPTTGNCIEYGQKPRLKKGSRGKREGPQQMFVRLERL